MNNQMDERSKTPVGRAVETRRPWLTLALAAMLLSHSAQAGAPPSPSTRMQTVIEQSAVTGGLLVLIDDTDDGLRSELSRSGRFLVQALVRDPQDVTRARFVKTDRNTYVHLWDGARLPYRDGIVNLIVSAREVDQAEVERVLTPRGVYLGPKGKYVKPVPADVDDWTHFLYGPENNAVSKDTQVAPPKGMQWQCGPEYTRHHELGSSFNAMVSAAGRVFYTIDEGSRIDPLLPARWILYARDGYNGALLWKKSLGDWVNHLNRYKFSSPSWVPRKLVAVGDEVYAPLDANAPVSVLDAATGNVKSTLPGTEGAYEIICRDKILYILAVADPAKQVFNLSEPAGERKLMAVKPADRKILWQVTVPRVTKVTLAVGEKSLFYYDGSCVVAVNRETGATDWTSVPLPCKKDYLTKQAQSPNLVVSSDLVLFSGGDRKMHALQAADGKKIWEADHLESGSASAEDLFVIDGKVWHAKLRSPSKENGPYVSNDLKTGQIVDKFVPDKELYNFHHRCHRAKATINYYLASHTGIEFIDLKAQTIDFNYWTRGACMFGIMPANGLVYAPPTPCGCYSDARLTGLAALTGSSAFSTGKTETRLAKGPAYKKEYTGDAVQPWPVYRHDFERSGARETSLPATLSAGWTTPLGGELTPPIIAGGCVYVAQKDRDAVVALDLKTGRERWRFIAGGRVDSAPTWHAGSLYFGCADGRIYCLDAERGELAWSYLAAPEDRQMVVEDRIESVWPVHGSLLIAKEPASGRMAVWALAGRNMFLDGGLFLSLLDARTGELIKAHVMNDINPETGKDLQLMIKDKGHQIMATRSDLFLRNGDRAFMFNQPFKLDGSRDGITLPHQFKDSKGQWRFYTQYERGFDDLNNYMSMPDQHRRVYPLGGFLNDTGFHRTGWIYGDRKAPVVDVSNGQCVPFGSLLVCDSDKVYAFGRSAADMGWIYTVQWRFYRSDKVPVVEPLTPREKDKNRTRAPVQRFKTDWEFQAPLYALAMAKAGDRLIAAGPPLPVDTSKIDIGDAAKAENVKELQELQDAWEGKLGALLRVMDASSGAQIQELKLDDLPVFDGMALGTNELVVALKSGKVVCLKGTE